MFTRLVGTGVTFVDDAVVIIVGAAVGQWIRRSQSGNIGANVVVIYNVIVISVGAPVHACIFGCIAPFIYACISGIEDAIVIKIWNGRTAARLRITSHETSGVWACILSIVDQVLIPVANVINRRGGRASHGKERQEPDMRSPAPFRDSHDW